MAAIMKPLDNIPVASPQTQEELLNSIDTLLERYLHLLDQYQTLQQGLSKQLSAVHSSL